MAGHLLVSVHHALRGADEEHAAKQQALPHIVTGDIASSHTGLHFVVQLVPREGVQRQNAPDAAAAEGGVELVLPVAVQRVGEILSVELIDSQDLIRFSTRHGGYLLNNADEFDSIELIFLHQRVKRERLLSAQESAGAANHEDEGRTLLPKLRADKLGTGDGSAGDGLKLHVVDERHVNDG